MPRIFVSYAQEDREAVSPYIAGLQAANFEVWWDGDLRGGDDWSESIEAELKRSDSVVIFWSKHSVESPWVRIEAHYGKQHQSLVPIRLDDVELPDEYRQVQTIDGRHDASSSLGELVSAVSGILGKRRSRRLRVTAACAVIAIVLGALGTQFPALLRSDNSTPEISDIGDAWKAMLQAATLYELNTVEKQFASLKISEVDAAVAYAGLCATALRRFDLTRRDADLVMAQGNCATAVELDRDNAFTAEARGWLAHYTGKPEQALEAFQSSITLAPDSASARLGLAVALKSQGRDDEAEQLLLEAMNRVQVAQVQQINDRAFFQQGSRWIDGNAINSDAGTRTDQTVVFGSPEFMQLLDRLAAENRQGTLSMSGDILVRVGDKNILVTGK